MCSAWLWWPGRCAQWALAGRRRLSGWPQSIRWQRCSRARQRRPLRQPFWNWMGAKGETISGQVVLAAGDYGGVVTTSLSDLRPADGGV